MTKQRKNLGGYFILPHPVECSEIPTNESIIFVIFFLQTNGSTLTRCTQ